MSRVRRKRATEPTPKRPINVPERLQGLYLHCTRCGWVKPVERGTPPLCEACQMAASYVSLVPLKKYEFKEVVFLDLPLEEQNTLLRESGFCICVYRGGQWVGMIGEDIKGSGKWGTGFNGVGFSHPHADLWEALGTVLVRYKR